MRSRQIKTIKDLSRAERRALEGIDIMHGHAGGQMGVTMQTLRANGNRRDVVERVCELGLAFAAGSYGDRDLVRFALSEAGRKILDDAEAPSYELLAQRYADLRAILVRLGPDWVEEIDRIEAADLRSTNDRPYDEWVPPQEWRPELNERVVDDRPASRGAHGIVLHVEMGGPHFADRDYWVNVRWANGRMERHIASHWLYREDGTQGQRTTNSGSYRGGAS